VKRKETLIVSRLYSYVVSSANRVGCLFPLFSISSGARQREILVLVQPFVSEFGMGDFKMIQSGDLDK